MKLNKLITTAVLVLVGGALIETSASAQLFSTGDLILSFQVNDGVAPGATSNLEVDLGSYTTFLSLAGTGQTLALNVGGSLGTGGLSVADLTSTYGNSWNTRTDLTFDVAGTRGTPSRESFVTDPTSAAKESSNNGLSFIGGEYNNGGGTASTHSTSATIIPTTTAGSFTYQVTNNGGFALGNDFGLTYNTQDGVTGLENTLSLYDLKSHAGTSTLGTELGVFELLNSGVLTYTATGAIPEPSTYALMGVAALVLLVARRRMLQV
jgi:hypothetical protein